MEKEASEEAGPNGQWTCVVLLGRTHVGRGWAGG